MTLDDLTAPDRPEDLNPPEPNDALRDQLLRVLDAADTVGLTIRSIHTGPVSWFVSSPSQDGWSLEQARSLAAALDAALIDIFSTTGTRIDFLDVRLNDQATLHIDIEKQHTAAECRAAAHTLGRLAGWGTPPFWMDPIAVRDAFQAARSRVTTPTELLALGAAAQTLAVTDDTTTTTDTGSDTDSGSGSTDEGGDGDGYEVNAEEYHSSIGWGYGDEPDLDDSDYTDDDLDDDLDDADDLNDADADAGDDLDEVALRPSTEAGPGQLAMPIPAAAPSGTRRAGIDHDWWQHDTTTSAAGAAGVGSDVAGADRDDGWSR